MFYFIPEYLKWWKLFQEKEDKKEDKTVPFGIS